MKNKLFFLAIVVIMSLMDVVNFRLLHDDGFFSITPSGFDVWHLLKLILYIMIVWYLFNKDTIENYGKASIELTIYIVIAVFPHWFILHYLF